MSWSTTIPSPVTDNLLLFCCTVIAQGINAGDLKKLQDAGIFTCNGLMMNTKKADLLNLSRFGYSLSTRKHKDFLDFLIFRWAILALTANHSWQIHMLFAGFVEHKGLVRRKSWKDMGCSRKNCGNKFTSLLLVSESIKKAKSIVLLNIHQSEWRIALRTFLFIIFIKLSLTNEIARSELDIAQEAISF